MLVFEENNLGGMELDQRGHRKRLKVAISNFRGLKIRSATLESRLGASS